MEKYSFGFTLATYNMDYNFFDTIKKGNVIELANNLLQGQLSLNSEIKEKIIFDINDFDWNMICSSSPNSIQQLLHSFNSILILTKAYCETGKKKYFDLATQFVESYFDYLDSENSDNNVFIWNRFSVSLRTKNLIYYLLVMKKNNKIDDKIMERCLNLLEEHLQFFINEENYIYNNHGIFMDVALLNLSWFRDKEKKHEYIEIVKKRLKKQIELSFNSENVHIENSPNYFIAVLFLLEEAAYVLHIASDEYAIELTNQLSLFKKILLYVIKPDSSLAQIGDTDKDDFNSNFYKKIFENENLIYAISSGKKGTKPNLLSQVLHKSGYYFYREHWEKKNFADATWMMFTAGYKTKVHKHADNTSFMLYTKNNDVFIDCGRYNYYLGDKYREYIVSAKAHNNVVVDDLTYYVTDQNAYKTGLLTKYIDKNYEYVLGFNDLFSDVKIDRHFYNIKGGIIIYDNIKSEKTHKYSQLFHLGKDIKIIESKNNEVLLKLNKQKYFVRIKQLLNNTTLKKDNGYFSIIFNKIDSTTTLKFEGTDSNFDYITLITIEDKKGNVDYIREINFDIESKVFDIKNNTGSKYRIALNERERFDVKKVKIEEISKNKFRITNETKVDNVQYAWYIYDKNRKDPIYKTVYENDNIIEYEFTEESEYYVQVFIRNKNYQRKKNIVASFKYDEKSKKIINNSMNFENFEFKINNDSYSRVSKNKYKFIVDYEYFEDVNIKWLIYKNGSSYDNINVYNEKTLEYEFKEKGDFAIMYYISPKYDDMQYYIFQPMIKIENI